MNNINDEVILKWAKNKEINPMTKRKIKINGPTYKKYQKIYDKLNKTNRSNSDSMIDNYIDYRVNKIDPLLHENLPLNNFQSEKDLFKFNYKWNPYTGDRLGIEEKGPLYFDPDTLIHYFYVNRLNNLWIKNNDNYQGYYGDAVGNGPTFHINGRGDFRNWYLFRLPIPDCYLDKNHNHQVVTMGPILNDNEIRDIYRKANINKDNYLKLYYRKRPNLLKMKKYYEKSISKNPLENILFDLDDSTIKEINYQENLRNILLLSKL